MLTQSVPDAAQLFLVISTDIEATNFDHSRTVLQFFAYVVEERIGAWQRKVIAIDFGPIRISELVDSDIDLVQHGRRKYFDPSRVRLHCDTIPHTGTLQIIG